jgi:hypothetical protein
VRVVWPDAQAVVDPNRFPDVASAAAQVGRRQDGQVPLGYRFGDPNVLCVQQFQDMFKLYG